MANYNIRADGSFEVEYKNFKGINANVVPEHIEDNEFAWDLAFGVSSTYLTQTFFLYRNRIYPGINFLNTFNAFTSGYADTNPVVVLASYTGSDGKKYIINITTSNVYKVTAGNYASIGAAPVTFTNNPIVYTLAVQNILYFAGTNGIGKVDATVPSTGTLTTFTGGIYLNELNGHILVGSTLEGGTPHRGRLRWSGVNNFSQFDSTIDATAGFQDIPDVSDSITGIFCFDNETGYLLRETGVTQILPTTSGTAPFQFNHLWRSDAGIGCYYPYTAAQYGPFGVFVGKDDIYRLSTGGFKSISGNARNAIFYDLLQTYDSLNVSQITGQIVPFLDSNSINTLPALCYILQIPTRHNQANPNSAAWIYNFNEESWSRIQRINSPTSLISTITDTTAIGNFKPGYTAYGANNNTGFGGSSNIQSFVNFTLDSTIGSPSILFRPERVAIGRKFTIRRIGIEYINHSAVDDTLNYSLKVDGTLIGGLSVVLPHNNTQDLSNTVFIDKVFTCERFQLVLRSVGGVLLSSSIVSITLFCTYKDGEQL